MASQFTTENLILLEFLVIKIGLDVEVRKSLKNITGGTYVSFQFLDNAPLLIHEKNFMNTKKFNQSQQSDIKHGKSCLFSLSPEQAENAMQCFDIHVEVFKQLQADVLPNKILIGESSISVSNLFKELIDAMYQNGESPAAKSFRDCYKITNYKGEIAGIMGVFVRMSCFGKLIVTDFQMSLEGNFLFKFQKTNTEESEKGKGDGSCVSVRKFNKTCV